MTRTPTFPSPLPQQPQATAEQLPDDLAPQPGDWQHASWAAVVAQLGKDFDKRSLAKLFPAAAAGGGVLRWGLAVAGQRPVTTLQLTLSELASGRQLSRPRSEAIQWDLAVEELIRDIDDLCGSSKLEPAVVAEAVLWAYALPPLITRLREISWKSLCQSLDCAGSPLSIDPRCFVAGTIDRRLRTGVGPAFTTQ